VEIGDTSFPSLKGGWSLFSVKERRRSFNTRKKKRGIDLICLVEETSVQRNARSPIR